MDQNDDKQEFRVVDKRRFTSEGDMKAGAVDAPAQAEESPRAKARPAANAQAASAKPLPEGERVGRVTTGPAAAEAEQPMDFASLVISLATQALVMMGEVPNPESRSVNINLDAAKQTIDILVLLEQKTKGNLTAEEEKLMAEVLTNLQLAFVKKIDKKK